MMTDSPSTNSAAGDAADAAPPVDPRVAALYAPPYAPGVLELPLTIHVDPDGMWATSAAFPGLFATGSTIPELGASLGEAVQSHLIENTTIVDTPDTPNTPTDGQAA